MDVEVPGHVTSLGSSPAPRRPVPRTARPGTAGTYAFVLPGTARTAAGNTAALRFPVCQPRAVRDHGAPAGTPAGPPGMGPAESQTATPPCGLTLCATAVTPGHLWPHWTGRRDFRDRHGPQQQRPAGITRPARTSAARDRRCPDAMRQQAPGCAGRTAARPREDAPSTG
jgi:hypothetical protein